MTKKRKCKKYGIINSNYLSIVGQNYPPTKIIDNIYNNIHVKHGEIIYNKDYGPDNLINYNNIIDFRKAAEVHRQVRAYIQKYLKPGKKIYDICEQIENSSRIIIKEDGYLRGVGFPTGISINNCAAHDTAVYDDTRIIDKNDVIKIDFGTQINGCIIDSAFTITFNHRYNSLLEAVKESTYTGIKNAGVDVRLADIGASIQEVMESYEIELDGYIYPIHVIKNLCGHNIDKYKIHADKLVPLYDNGDNTKMEDGEIYAIETFGSTGKGYVYPKETCTHYMLNKNSTVPRFRFKKTKQIYNHILQTYNTLPFCDRWFNRPDGGSYTLHRNNGKISAYNVGLNELCEKGVVSKYPPLYDIEGSYIAQYEHTIQITEKYCEVISKGIDY